MGVDKPNYTQIPNLLLDDLMGYMGEAELKVTMAIARRTFGYHRDKVEISISTLKEMTHLSRQGVINGITAGLKRGTLTRTDGKRGGFVYELVFNDEIVTSQRSRLVNEVDQSLVNEVDRTSQRSRPKYSGLKKSIKERGKESTMPPPERLSTLPGVSKPRQRFEKRDADRIARQRDALGLSAKELTTLTDTVLVRMNALDLANSGTDFGDEEFTQAQQTTLALASVGYKTPDAIHRLYACWPTDDWRGKKGESPTYKTIVEHAKAMGMRQPQAAPQTVLVVERMDGDN